MTEKTFISSVSDHNWSTKLDSLGKIGNFGELLQVLPHFSDSFCAVFLESEVDANDAEL